MAGVRNQARLAAQLRLRREVARQDELVRAYFGAAAAVGRAERKLSAIRARCERRLREAEAGRDEMLQARADVLAEVALALGDQRAAEILELSLNRVRAARRSTAKPSRSAAATGRTLTSLVRALCVGPSEGSAGDTRAGAEGVVGPEGKPAAGRDQQSGAVDDQ
jgi:hypothetical protein